VTLKAKSCRQRNGAPRKNGGECMAKKRAKQDTVNYTLRKGRKTVYKGITNDLDRRLKKHKRDGKKFTSVAKSRKVSRETARKREKAGIKGYKQNTGKKPRLNKKG